jgi:hypothetical protein
VALGLRFPLPIFIPPISPQSPSPIIRGWYNRPVSGRSTQSPTPPVEKKYVDNQVPCHVVSSYTTINHISIFYPNSEHCLKRVLWYFHNDARPFSKTLDMHTNKMFEVSKYVRLFIWILSSILVFYIKTSVFLKGVLSLSPGGRGYKEFLVSWSCCYTLEGMNISWCDTNCTRAQQSRNFSYHFHLKTEIEPMSKAYVFI